MLRELRVEINKHCNFACVHCYTDKYRHTEVTVDRLVALMEELAPQGLTDLSITGGEPLMDLDRVVAMSEAANTLGLTVRLNTNGVLLRPRVCDRLIDAGVQEFQVSLNAADPDEFDDFVQTPNAFHQVVSGMRHLSERDAYLTVRFTLMDRTAPQLVSTFKLAEDVGVKAFKVRTLVEAGGISQELDAEVVERLRRHSHDFFEAISGSSVKVRFSDNGLEFGVPETANCTFLSCLCGSDALFISAEGNVTPCPFLRDEADWLLGNANDESLVDIYNNSERLQTFIGEKYQESDGCGNSCSDGCKASNYFLTGDADQIYQPHTHTDDCEHGLAVTVRN